MASERVEKQFSVTPRLHERLLLRIAPHAPRPAQKLVHEMIGAIHHRLEKARAQKINTALRFGEPQRFLDAICASPWKTTVLF